MKIRVAIIAFLIFLCPCVFAGPATFQKANALYQSGDYGQAVLLYESLIKNGEKDANTYYNLGNAYFKQEQLGQAILNYEKARRLNPRDRDVTANLNYAKGLLEYRMDDKRNWYLKFFDAVLEKFTMREIGILAMTFALILWIVWSVALYFQAETGWGWRRKVVLILAMGFASLWVLKGVYEKQNQQAIVLKAQAAVRYGPSYKDQVALKLGEGMKVRIKGHDGEWNRVALKNGETGWMYQDDMGVI